MQSPSRFFGASIFISCFDYQSILSRNLKSDIWTMIKFGEMKKALTKWAIKEPEKIKL